MYATGYFMVGLVGLVSFQVVAVTGTQRAGDLSMATNLSASTMEMMRVTPVQSLTTQANPLVVYYDRYGIKQGATGYTTAYFTVTSSVTSVSGATYLEAKVTTSWQASVSNPFVHGVSMQSRLPTTGSE
jgi:Tfp pilus assembly protein PilV